MPDSPALDDSSLDWPSHPIVVRLTRAGVTEAVHRGAWCLVDTSGRILAEAGDVARPMWTRSAIKSLQALPFLETGGVDRFRLEEDELAVMLASHNAEAQHVAVVRRLLARAELGEEHLRCGNQVPTDPDAAYELRAAGREPRAIHNNCSGKHAGFLALARHLDVDPARYLDPESEGQRRVRAALAEMCDLDPATLTAGIDGCSAPNWRVPLRNLALAFARLTNPDGLPSARAACCRRITAAAAAYPELIGGRYRRLDTDLLRVSGGRLFPKIGAEGMYAIGIRDTGLGLAVKIDDGTWRAVHALVVGLLEKLELAKPDELAGLNRWRETTLTNWAGLDVGRIEAVIE